MHYLPLAVDASKQKSLVSPVVYLPPVSVDGGFDLDIGNRPREIALHVCLDVTENQIKPVQRIAFGFNVMNDQIIKTFVLAATLYVTRVPSAVSQPRSTDSMISTSACSSALASTPCAHNSETANKP
jgi:hypothetical protein